MCPGAILFTPSASQRTDRSISTVKAHSVTLWTDRLRNTLHSEAQSRERLGLQSHCWGNRGQEPIRELCSGGLPEASRGLSRFGGSLGHHRPQFRGHRPQRTQLPCNSQFYKDLRTGCGRRGQEVYGFINIQRNTIRDPTEVRGSGETRAISSIKYIKKKFTERGQLGVIFFTHWINSRGSSCL